jgi:hypothetical protein
MSTRAHIALAVLVALAILVIIRLVRRRHLKPKYSLLWLTLGGFMVVIAAVPGLLDWTATRLGIYYQPTLLILLGLALLLLIVMHFSYELSRMENRVRTLAEEAAILRHRVASLEAGGEPDQPSTIEEASGSPTDTED